MKTTLVHQELYGKTYAEVVAGLNTKDNQGDCCGWAYSDVKDELAELSEVEKGAAKLVACVLVEYDDETDTSSRVVCNFLFDTDDKIGLLLGYDLSAGSGSGWSYGAYVSLNFLDQEIARASW